METRTDHHGSVVGWEWKRPTGADASKKGTFVVWFSGIVTRRKVGKIFERRKPFRGGVAQLGEHLPCKQGVMGSIPIISTKITMRMQRIRNVIFVEADGSRRNHAGRNAKHFFRSRACATLGSIPLTCSVQQKKGRWKRTRDPRRVKRERFVAQVVRARA